MSRKHKTMFQINVKRLVNAEIKDKLYFNTKGRNSEKIVWQQMTCENFYKFLKNNALFFKNLTAYDEKDERKLEFYEKSYLQSNDNDLIKKLYKDFEKIAYISCWFDLPWLTKLVFDAYAGDAGIAIGVEKDTLLTSIDNNFKSKNNVHEEIFCGNVAYLDDEYRDVVESDEAIAPLFLKSNYHSSDNEFRLVHIRDSLWQGTSIGMKLPDKLPDDLIQIGSLSDFIKYIAVRDCEETFKSICERCHLRVKRSHKKMDGFIIYEIDSTTEEKA